MKQYIVDAFTDQVFHGNQTAICVLDRWPSAVGHCCRVEGDRVKLAGKAVLFSEAELKL